ncbi:hypothetical protein Sbs19_12790 [Sphingobium sp. BS19]|nr:hypothetical protein Sbs19_12790 [Sphingobium sp. BS19]
MAIIEGEAYRGFVFKIFRKLLGFRLADKSIDVPTTDEIIRHQYEAEDRIKQIKGEIKDGGRPYRNRFRL